ncbi:LysE family translocator [Vibrio campbellii]|uniref:LysE family translocator n=1 Tax=Vibrio campbellii TaxID=680 RepID=UPI0002AE5622|nr:LysE family translocator [Vibrio campbellii]ARV72749.1 lysine transporter LysE [Vibrio campbellii CAIM 519 = NBRC 15631 = ATCC 25920]ELU51233.1 amino acid transporter LysE [Vibrio campbellii CAIM 519 = NBRC 15631 = ATCC 25920]
MSVLIAMSLFSFSMSISPGPVNLIALTSGLNYGFWRSIPFVSGATIGFTLLLLLIGLGIGTLLSNYTQPLEYLSYFGCGFILYMGIKIFSVNPQEIKGADFNDIPSFTQGIFMQWLNPKAWMACLAGCSAFNVHSSNEALATFVSIYFLICYLGIGCWSFLGEKMSVYLKRRNSIAIFNKVMGGMLCLIAIYLFFI